MTLTTESAHPHVITAECPVPCLAGKLPTRALNALNRELRPDPHSHGTVADIARLHSAQRLEETRGIGVGGIVKIQAVLAAAGLTENSDQHPDHSSAAPRPA